MTHRNLLFVAAAGCALCEAQAVSFRLPNQDPEAIARGNAFAATADNPSAIYYNPAGITQIEGQALSFGMYFVSAGTKYFSPFGMEETDKQFQPVPQLYYVLSPKDSKFSYGLGVYAPFGLGLDWGETVAPLKYLGQKGKVMYATVNPVGAYQIFETLSIAAGPTFNYSQASLHVPLAVPGLGKFNFKGDGFDVGFNAGLLWKPHQKVALGVTYRHQTDINYEGHSEFTPLPRSQTSGELHYPLNAVAGISFRPTENWNFEFNLDWTDWDSVNQVNWVGTTFPPFVLNHRSSFMYEFGITRKLAKGYFVSGGYFYSENSVPDATFNPLIPDSNLHLGSIGFGHKGERWDWAVGYHFATNGDGRTVKGSPMGLADGRYETLNHGVNFSTVIKF